MDFSSLDNYAAKPDGGAHKIADHENESPAVVPSLLDGTFDAPPTLAADCTHYSKSLSTDDFEHILSDKIDTAAHPADNNKYAAAAGNIHDLLAGDGLAASAEPLSLFEGKKAATIDFMAAERQPYHGVSGGNAAPFVAEAPSAVAAAFETVDDDDLVGSAVTAEAPLKRSIYDDLEQQEKFAGSAPMATATTTTTTTVPSATEKFISTEDLLGDFDNGADSDADEVTPAAYHQQSVPAPAAPKVIAEPPAPRQRTPDLFEASEDVKQAAHFDVIATPAVTVPAPVVVAPVIVPAAAPAPVPEPVLPAEPIVPVVVKTEAPKPAARKGSKVEEVKSVSAAPRILADEIFCKIGLDAWFTPERLHPRVESLIYWRDVKKSGIVFGAGLAFLLAISICSVISVFAYSSLIALVAAVSFRIYKNVLQAVQKTPEGHPFQEYLSLELSLPQDKVQEVAAVAVAHVNALVAELRRLFLVEDLIDSIKFGALLWGLTYVGSWFNGMTLVILAFVALFTFPKIYENNKTDIDAHLGLVRSKIEEITEKIKAAVPIGKKAAVAATESEKDK